MRKILIAVLAVIAMLFIYKIGTFELFEDEVRQLRKIEIDGESYDLAIYHAPSNATVESSIQIRKLHNDDVQETVANYTRYNNLISFELRFDEIELIIEDEIREKVDTVIYNLNQTDFRHLNRIEIISLPLELNINAAIRDEERFDSVYHKYKDTTVFSVENFTLKFGEELTNVDRLDIRAKVTCFDVYNREYKFFVSGTRIAMFKNKFFECGSDIIKFVHYADSMNVLNILSK